MINYPNGKKAKVQPASSKAAPSPLTRKVRYPNGTIRLIAGKKESSEEKLKTRKLRNSLSASRRGMVLEKDINLTNESYLEDDIAVIHKKPTPVQIVKVDYPKRSAAKITEAYFKVPSTTDYNGIYRGRYLDFEAKETRTIHSFPLKNIHPHQITHLAAVLRHGAIAFLVVRFTELNETWYVPAEKAVSFWDHASRRSIPHDWFEENGILIHSRNNRPVDYLRVVDQLYFRNGGNPDESSE